MPFELYSSITPQGYNSNSENPDSRVLELSQDYEEPEQRALLKTVLDSICHGIRVTKSSYYLNLGIRVEIREMGKC